MSIFHRHKKSDTEIVAEQTVRVKVHQEEMHLEMMRQAFENHYTLVILTFTSGGQVNLYVPTTEIERVIPLFRSVMASVIPMGQSGSEETYSVSTIPPAGKQGYG